MIRALRRYGLLAVLTVLLMAAAVSGAWRWISFDALQAHHVQLKALVARGPAVSAAAFFALFVAVIAACIPGPSLMMVASGYLFGPATGGLIGLAACVAGSILVAGACRSAFAEAVARRGGPRLRAVQRTLSDHGFTHLVSLKLLPAVPMFVANIAAGVAGLRLTVVAAATALGSAPICFILAGLGWSLGRVLDRGGRIDHHVLERPEVWLPLAGLFALSVAAMAWRAIRRTVR